MTAVPDKYKIATMYQFADLPDVEEVYARFYSTCLDLDLKGLLIVAPEGINGTISGAAEQVDSFVLFIRKDERFATIKVKFSWSKVLDPMDRLRVIIRDEIVTMGCDEVDPRKNVGEYVDALQWNALVDDPKTCIIDTRNHYEVNIGSFQGALDPQTETFRDFPDWVENNRDRLESFERIAMFCTGGIRCEKATSYLLEGGFKNVFHLDGGILKYLEKVDPERSRWVGDCFVFDKRVSVGHGLEPGSLIRCRGCRHPLNKAALVSPLYEHGVSCEHCYWQTSEAQKERYRERKRQVELAESRGESHLGENSGFDNTRKKI